jgi:hypothetical protein
MKLAHNEGCIQFNLYHYNVAATVAAGAAIPDGSISVDIKYGGAEIAHETVKLCDTTTCPTPATVGGCTSRNPVDP